MFERYQNAKRALLARLYKGMNERQLDAVFSVKGPLLVIAGAGSGKTTVLVNRIAHIIRWGNMYYDETVPEGMTEDFVASLEKAAADPDITKEEICDLLESCPHESTPPWAMLAITFTNKAAKEMKERLGKVLGDESMAKEVCGGNLPLDLRAHPETFRREYRRAEGFLDLRHGRPEEARHRVPEGARARRQDVPGPRNYERDFPREGYSSRPERVRGGGGERFQALEARRGLHDVSVASRGGGRARFRRHNNEDREAPPRERGGEKLLPEALQVRLGRRVSGHEQGAVRADEAALRRVPEHHGGRRRRPVDI